ncbi:MAG: hypothetical protein ABIM40_07755 [Pseudomonadota bacterium]
MKQMQLFTDEPEGEVIFTKTIRLRNGRVLYAHQYGLKAFRIRVRAKKQSEQ